jgi:hypothetical protein
MKKLVINKRIAALVLLLVICTFSVAADDFGLDEKIGMVLQMLSSPWVKGIACIALIVECIGLITAGRQEPGMFGPAEGLECLSPGLPGPSSLWRRALSPVSLSP